MYKIKSCFWQVCGYKISYSASFQHSELIKLEFLHTDLSKMLQEEQKRKYLRNIVYLIMSEIHCILCGCICCIY